MMLIKITPSDLFQIIICLNFFTLTLITRLIQKVVQIIIFFVTASWKQIM
jgi:hypothetical protein